MTSIGASGHTLTNNGVGAWNSTTNHNWVYESTVNNEHIYRMSGHPSNAFYIKYNGTYWEDAGSSEPGFFGTSATDSTAINPLGSATTLYLWTGTTFTASLNNAYPEGTSTSSVPSTTKKVFCNFW